MRQSLLIALSCLVVAGQGHASRIDPRHKYPRFQFGVTGIYATIEPGRAVTVDSVEAGSPAAGKLDKGNVILVASGRAVQGADPRVPLVAAMKNYLKKRLTRARRASRTLNAATPWRKP